MLEIVLLILKIVGIILAALLGILIIAAGCILFVPVRYRGDFFVDELEDGGGKSVEAAFRAFWLMRLVRMYVSREENVRIRVKLFLFTLYDTAKEKKADKKKDKKRENKKSRKKAEAPEEAEMDVEEGMPDGDGGDQLNAEAGTSERDREEDKIEETGKYNKNGRAEDSSVQREKRGIKKFISIILQTIRDFCDKLKKIRERAEKIEELWKSEHMVSSRSLLGRQLTYLLKHSRPGNLEGYLRFGFEDPSTTGYAMAAYGILYPVWSPKLSVEPDFEKQVLAAHIRIRGKLRVWHFLRVALSLYLSKDVRRVIKDIAVIIS